MAAHDLLSYERNWDKKQKRKQLPRNMQQSYEVPAADWALFGKTSRKQKPNNMLRTYFFGDGRHRASSERPTSGCRIDQSTITVSRGRRW